MKRKSLLLILIPACFAILFNHCTESVKPETHSNEWMDTDSENFHGREFAQKGPEGIEYCKACHGEDYRGGTSEISCYQCHAGGESGHPEQWLHLTWGTEEFHGNAFFDDPEWTECQQCHGEDLTGGSSGISCYLCHTGGPTGHPALVDFMNYDSTSFHSNVGAWNSVIERCQNCHGENLDGGIVGISCTECHQGPYTPHPDTYLTFGDPQFHSHTGDWQTTVDQCRGCHGSELDGGLTGVSCTNCHQGGFTAHDPGFDFETHNLLGSWEDVNNQCRGCHGSDLDGGFVGFSCNNCHGTDGSIGHPDGFLVFGDANFHGNTGEWDTVTPQCTACHGTDLSGGITGVACNTCHLDNFPGHSDGFELADHPLLGNGNWDESVILCMNCHGNDLQGGMVNVDCVDCHQIDGSFTVPHLPGIMEYGYAEFHGENRVWNVDIPQCQLCHGDDLTGGLAGVSCVECHEPGSPVHIHDYALELDPTADEYHGRRLWENGWNFSYCQSCHGEDFSGGMVDQSCNSCHYQQDNVGFCGNCHGDRSVSDHFYPPLSIMNESDPALITVGAHEAHMQTDLTNISCDQCHIVPDNYMDEGHLGSDNIAEINFNLDYANNISVPEYDPINGTCSNVYCHGAFSFSKDSSSNQWGYQEDFITGSNATMTWNDTAGTSCNTCHSLPPQGHSNFGNACGNCHSSVVDSNFNIIDPSKHINGMPDLN